MPSKKKKCPSANKISEEQNKPEKEDSSDISPAGDKNTVSHTTQCVVASRMCKITANKVKLTEMLREA